MPDSEPKVPVNTGPKQPAEPTTVQKPAPAPQSAPAAPVAAAQPAKPQASAVQQPKQKPVEMKEPEDLHTTAHEVLNQDLDEPEAPAQAKAPNSSATPVIVVAIIVATLLIGLGFFAVNATTEADASNNLDESSLS